MSLRTIKNRVIIKPTFVPDVSSSGIFLGEGEMKDEGEVLAIGPDVLDCSVGDTVLFLNGAGRQATAGKEKILILPDTDIIAVFSK